MDTERSREEFRPYLWAVISPRAVPATAIFIRGTTAATLNYISPKVGGFSFGLQYSYAWKFYSVGDREAFGNQDPAYVLSNSDYSLLNNAFLRFDLDNLGLKESSLTFGRQRIDLTFAATYNIRQKEQAYEAIVFDLGHFEGLKLSAGILDKFSSWSSRDDLTSGGTAVNFIPIERTEGVTYSTTGFQFVEASFTGVEKIILTLYDYIGDDLYNTFGVNFDYTLFHSDDLSAEARLKYIGQRGFKRFEETIGAELRADAIQAGVKILVGNMSLEPGVFIVAGDGPGNDLRSPFQPKYIIEEPMVETDFGFTGGARSIYLEGKHAWSKNSLYFLYLYTDVKSPGFRGETNEWDIILSRNFSESFFAKLKVAFVKYDGDTSKTRLIDYRVFAGWNF